ncbi:hypothetical protein Pyn_37815 [Prunus yedoensis var. nudiflora]|uniref:C2H2-type domain-containing protein n=1 Tax=Prunus yedoensis var. nudiflora TaxID=2094558 RepID=A0A314USJ1_PRUYE|nr:hypothetical protein Pyn_37815 [Prunus yedoensis var. nudiflora]
MDLYEDELFCRYCDGFSSHDPEALLDHMIESHKFAHEVQGLKAEDNGSKCIICASNKNSKTFTSHNALESHMDRVHHGWETLPELSKEELQ